MLGKLLRFTKWLAGSSMVAAVFIAISHWMHKAAKKPKAAACLDETAHQLAQCVRFPMLSNDFLHFVVSQVLYSLSSTSCYSGGWSREFLHGPCALGFVTS